MKDRNPFSRRHRFLKRDRRTASGVRLSVVVPDALRTALDVVAVCRDLAEADPDLRRPDLAAALLNLGRTFVDLGLPAEGVPVIKEAVDIYMDLAIHTDFTRYRPYVASSSARLAAILWELGRYAEAVVYEKDATIWKNNSQADS